MVAIAQVDFLNGLDSLKVYLGQVDTVGEHKGASAFPTIHPIRLCQTIPAPLW